MVREAAEMGNLREATHALVDGVRYSHAFERLYSRDDIADIEPLYLTTRWASLAEQGPILVRLRGTGLPDEVLRDEQGEWPRALTWLQTDASSAELADHLRQFVTFRGTGQHEKLLRFADPLVTRHWLASHGNAVPADVMGSVHKWWVAEWSPSWGVASVLAWHAFQSDESSRFGEHDERPLQNVLGAPQLAALEAVTRWQFKEQLAEHFQDSASQAWQALPPEGRGEWMDARIDDAMAWGASTERQIAIWLDLSLHWGENFMSASDGLYLHWIARTAQAAGLSRQERLYALDVWSRTPEAMALQGKASSRTISENEVSDD
ncbi:DUF4123 domain-containing protein [Halomonas sp. DQ26W]|uniref:DUF4123 domain-containing protein n=1 Tax=Halomonas sp. DQ26W TaxID=2282311 RepID=UPI000DF76741|nr:DUF4123 domain-containing protein [Halomonas sp. DQ26W]RDB41758.1 DUF4123 domain-containing protein [Halomonas sp. DQ26W]